MYFFKYVNACFVLGRVVANHRHAICKRNCWKVSYCYWCLYLHFTLFRMHVEITNFGTCSSSEIEEIRNGQKSNF